MTQTRTALILLALFALILSACTESDDTSTGSGIGSFINGQFVDAPVVGLGFSSTGSVGNTDSTGAFRCRLGDMLTFSVGDLEIGQAPCSAAIFPMHLTGESSISSTGGAVALGVLFSALDTTPGDGVFTIPTSVRSMEFAATLDFSTFNSGTGLAAFRAILDEINTDTGLGLDANDIQTNYAATHAPAAVAELQDSLTDPQFVDLPSNIANFSGKYFLISGSVSAGSSPLCAATAGSLYAGVGITSASVGSGTAYTATLFEATAAGIDASSSVGAALVTGVSASLAFDETLSGSTVASHLVVAFSETTTAMTGSAMVVTTTSGTSVTCYYNVTGTEATPLVAPGPSTALLTISGSPFHDFGAVSVGSSSNATLTVTNSGGGTATSLADSGLAAPFSFSGGVYPGTGGTCGASLASGSTCNIVVSFAPAGTGTVNDTVVIDYNNGTSAQSATRDLEGMGSAAAVLVISDGPTYDYGSVATSSSSSHSFTVTNTGGGPASAISENGLAAPFTFVGGVYPGTGGTCTSTIASGASCIMVIQFSPTITGVANDTINLNYNDGASAQSATRNVTGTGI